MTVDLMRDRKYIVTRHFIRTLVVVPCSRSKKENPIGIYFVEEDT